MAQRVNVVVEKDEDGYHAFVPQLPGRQTQGDTLESVLANVREAVDAHLESLDGDADQRRSVGSDVAAPVIELEYRSAPIRTRRPPFRRWAGPLVRSGFFATFFTAFALLMLGVCVFDQGGGPGGQPVGFAGLPALVLVASGLLAAVSFRSVWRIVTARLDGPVNTGGVRDAG